MTFWHKFINLSIKETFWRFRVSPVFIALLIILPVAIIGLLIIILKNTLNPKRIENIPKIIKQGKTQSAIKVAKQLLQKNPKNFAIHYYLGKAYLADNKPELAIMEYKSVNENALFGQQIKEVEFRTEFSQLLLKSNQTQEALREFLLLTKLDPHTAENFYQAGHLYESIGRYDLALGLLKKTVIIDKRHAKAHAEIGLLLYRTKQFGEAKKEIDTALKLSPDTYSSYYYLGKILKDSKDIPGAIKAFENAQRDPEFKLKALIERGTCYMMVNRYDNAIPDFQRAIELDKQGNMNEVIYARYFLAQAYEKIRKIDKAIEQWEFIYRRNKAFRDVASKLNEYKDLQTNDFMKDYLTTNDDEFILICKNTCNTAMNLQVVTCDKKKWGCQITGFDKKFEVMLGVRKQIIFIRFYREPNPIEENELHAALDEMKSLNSVKGFLFSSSGFSNTAKRFAEGRPVELIEKAKLEKLLTAAGKQAQ